MLVCSKTRVDVGDFVQWGHYFVYVAETVKQTVSVCCNFLSASSNTIKTILKTVLKLMFTDVTQANTQSGYYFHCSMYIAVKNITKFGSHKLQKIVFDALRVSYIWIHFVLFIYGRRKQRIFEKKRVLS